MITCVSGGIMSQTTVSMIKTTPMVILPVLVSSHFSIASLSHPLLLPAWLSPYWRHSTSRGSTMRLESDVEVHLEFVGVWSQPDRVDLVGPLPVDPRLDQVLGEHVTFGEVVVVCGECVQRPVERSRYGRDVGVLFRRELVEVLVDRLRWLRLVPDTVQTGHQHRRERKVRVARWVGSAELDPLGLRRGARHRDTDRRGSVALGVHQVD